MLKKVFQTFTSGYPFIYAPKDVVGVILRGFEVSMPPFVSSFQVLLHLVELFIVKLKLALL